VLIMTGENQSIWRKTYPSTTLSITNPTMTGLGPNQGLHSERLTTNFPSPGTGSTLLKLHSSLHISGYTFTIMMNSKTKDPNIV